jgi:hypothetical protein
MKQNVCGNDRIARFIAAGALFTYGLKKHSWLGLLGLIPLFNGVFRFCLINSLLGINTCKKKLTT